MKTVIITAGRHRLLIGEHPGNIFISSDVDGTNVGGFYTPEQAMQAAGEIIAAVRRIKKRAALVEASSGSACEMETPIRIQP